MTRNTFESVLMRWDEPRNYYTAQSKSEREISYCNTYIQNLEK